MTQLAYAPLRPSPTAMILVVDNYDSFTYNLVHLIGRHGIDLRVIRNDELTVAEVDALQPTGILISPGPGRPADAGISKALIEQLGDRIPILGVCLGHQAIGEVFGATVTYAPDLMHGKTSEVEHENGGVFRGAPSPMTATRYHSLTLAPDTLPRRTRGDGAHVRRHDHGRSPQDVAHRRRAVSPRKRTDRTRPPPRRQLARPVRRAWTRLSKSVR